MESEQGRDCGEKCQVRVNDSFKDLNYVRKEIPTEYLEKSSNKVKKELSSKVPRSESKCSMSKSVQAQQIFSTYEKLLDANSNKSTNFNTINKNEEILLSKSNGEKYFNLKECSKDSLLSTISISDKGLMNTSVHKMTPTSLFYDPSSNSSELAPRSASFSVVESCSLNALPSNLNSTQSDFRKQRHQSFGDATGVIANNFVESFSNSLPSKTPAPLMDKNNADLILNAVLSQSWMQSSQHTYHPLAIQMPIPSTLSSALNKISWRKGKWIDEEGVYTKKLIEAFNNGWLKIPSGTTLRSFLAEQLSCDPMRITKKFAGSSAIGKQVFVPCDPGSTDSKTLKEVQDELNDLGEKFRAKVEMAQNSTIFPMTTQVALAAAIRGTHQSMQGRTAPYFEGLPAEVLRSIAIAQQSHILRNSLIGSTQLGSKANSSSCSNDGNQSPDLSSIYFNGSVGSNGAPNSSNSIISTHAALFPPEMNEAVDSTKVNETKPKYSSSLQAVDDHEYVLHNSVNASFFSNMGSHIRKESKLPEHLLGDPVLTSVERVKDSSELMQAYDSFLGEPLSRKNSIAPCLDTELKASSAPLKQDNEMEGKSGTGSSTIRSTHPYELLYNVPIFSGLASTNISSVAKKPKKDKKVKKIGSSVDDCSSQGVSNRDFQSKSGGKMKTASCEDLPSPAPCVPTPQQQQQLLSLLQMELLSNSNKNRFAEVRPEIKSRPSNMGKKHHREISSQQQQMNYSNSLQAPQSSGDLYASDLLMNFFKAANYSPVNQEKENNTHSSGFDIEGDRVNPSGMNNNSSSSSGSDRPHSNNGSSSHNKMSYKSHTTSESDSSSSSSGNDELERAQDRRCTSSPLSSDDVAPTTTGASNNKRKSPFNKASSTDLDTGSDNNKNSDMESTDESSRHDECCRSEIIETTVASKDGKNGQCPTAESDNFPKIERRQLSSSNLQSLSNNGMNNSNNNNLNSKKRSRGLERTEGEMLLDSDIYCTLDTLQSQGETIDSNARKNFVQRNRVSASSAATNQQQQQNGSLRQLGEESMRMNVSS